MKAAAMCVIVLLLVSYSAGHVVRIPKVSIPLDLTQQPMYNPNVNLTLFLEESLFIKITNAFVPVLNAIVDNATIPGETTEHFSFNSFSLSGFHLGGIDISFNAVGQLSINLMDLTFVVPSTHFCVMDKILFIHVSCCGEMQASITNANIENTYSVSNVNQALNIAYLYNSAQIGSVNVNHHFDSFLCRVGQDIIQLFIGNIDTKIKDLIQNQLPGVVGPALAEAFNKIFEKLPFPLLGQPVVSYTGIEITAEFAVTAASPSQVTAHSLPRRLPVQGGRGPRAVARPKNMVRSKPAHGRAQPMSRALPPIPMRDLELFIADQAIDILLQGDARAGRLAANYTTPATINTTELQSLIPAAYTLCPGCPLYIALASPLAPQAAFDNGQINLTVINATFNIGAVNTSTHRIVPLVNLYLNAILVLESFTSSGPTDSTLKFMIDVPTFTIALGSSNIGNVDTAVLTQIVDFLLHNFIVPDFNAHFAGLTIPTMDGVGLGDFTIAINYDYFGMGTNLLLPNSTSV